MTTRIRLTLGAAIALGVGFMAALDEIVFHQLLAWHHFVDLAAGTWALASDGVLHTLELLALTLGGCLMLRLHETGRQVAGYRSAGALLGMGGFQLFDGIVDHKLLGLHQVRYVEVLWPYDLAWNAAGVVLLGVGVWLLRRARRRRAA